MNPRNLAHALVAVSLAAPVPLASAADSALVPGVTFPRGDAAGIGLRRERPVHQVRVGAFRIDKHEVTNAEYAAFLNEARERGLVEVRDGRVYGKPRGILYCNTSAASHASRILHSASSAPRFSVAGGPARSGDDYGRHPVTEVTWFGAVAYAGHHGKRLPTEAEWELAARGTRNTALYPCAGSQKDPKRLEPARANFSRSGDDYETGPVPKTTPVGSYAPENFGLFDMTGNVAEWCADWYDDNAYSAYPPEEWPADPQGPSATTGRRVIRGGAWQYEPFFCRSSARAGLPPQTTSPVVGFRCVTAAP